VFLDKDGTLLVDVPYNADPRRVILADGALDSLLRLAARDWRLFVVTNQPGVGMGLFGEEALERVERRIRELLAPVPIAGFYYCPHRRDAGCDCRKPGTGLLLRAAREHGVSLADSWMVGDILDDVEAGRRAGCRTVLIDNGGETEWKAGPLRAPHRRARGMRDAVERIIEAS
jgi:histidinol-phosphate phosphatase family protein